jgi:hypothetical protein
VIISIILSRLSVWYDTQLSSHQFGVRASRSTSDGIFIIKRIQQIMARRQLPVYFLYVDLSAAFDHIVRSWLWKIVRLRFPAGSDTTLIDILESLYADTKWKLDEIIFDTTSGVRQGGGMGS